MKSENLNRPWCAGQENLACGSFPTSMLKITVQVFLALQEHRYSEGSVALSL